MKAADPGTDVTVMVRRQSGIHTAKASGQGVARRACCGGIHHGEAVEDARVGGELRTPDQNSPVVRTS
jgi:hypothetical protein